MRMFFCFPQKDECFVETERRSRSVTKASESQRARTIFIVLRVLQLRRDFTPTFCRTGGKGAALFIQLMMEQQHNRPIPQKKTLSRDRD